MPLPTIITATQFETIQNEINAAATSEQLKKIFNQITSFHFDNNHYRLAICFNDKVKTKDQTIQSAVMLFDLEYMAISLKLYAASHAVQQYITSLSGVYKKPFDFQTHWHQLDKEIKAQQTSRYYSACCTFFYNNIYGPLIQHHPKLQYQAPSCVSAFLEKETAAMTPAMGS